MTNESLREALACKVCSNWPDKEGWLHHGKGCFTQSEDGGGDEFIAEALPEHQESQPVAWDVQELIIRITEQSSHCSIADGASQVYEGRRVKLQDITQIAAELQRLAERVREFEKLHADAIELAKDFAERAELAEQQLAQCRKDAERYRWLRKGGDYYLHCINPDAGHIEGENLDLIIDRAELAKTKGEKP